MKRKRMKIADLWDYLPPEARYVAIGATPERKPFWTPDAPVECSMGWAVKESHDIGIAIDYDGDWKDSLHERPQEIKPGMFGKFWDGEGEPGDVAACWGYLQSPPDYDSRTPFESITYWWDRFRPCTPPAQVEI